MVGNIRRVSTLYLLWSGDIDKLYSGTNWYDQAHSETVLEYLDFSGAKSDGWWCIEGGAQQLAINMKDKLKDQGNSIAFQSRITRIDASTQGTVKVQVNGQLQETAYAGVFNLTSMGCMQQMDLRTAALTYGQKQAIRALGYGASCKVGMKFRYPWWITIFGIKKGGLGHSDFPIRTTVYPSYNLYDSKCGSVVLLCSYEWQQDAQRIGTLVFSSTDHERLSTRRNRSESLFYETLHSCMHTNPEPTWNQMKSTN